MLKNFLWFAAILFHTVNLCAQNRYAVYLTDKNNSPFSVSNPIAFLSQRAIDRRAAQNIPVNTSDLPVNPSYVSQIAATGATVLTASRWLNAVTIEVPNPSVLNAVNSLPFVQQIKNVGIISSPDRLAKNKFENHRYVKPEPYFKNGNQTMTSFNYGPSFNQIAMIGGEVLHGSGKTGQGMVIAVIDAGFFNADNMIVFDSLRNQNRLLGTRDFIDNNSQVYDDHAHGSFVLSIMAGNWPGNIVGTAPHASYWLLRSEYAPTETLMEEFYWASAAEFADSAGADIINSSLGYYEFDNPLQNHTYADMDGNSTPVTQAADMAAAKGIVVCNSAGNEGASPWNYIIAPADADSILSVGAVDDLQNYAWFSSNGPTADGRVKPNVAAQGQGTYVADLSNNGVFAGNGTSFSSPVMAGISACLWQCNPNATNMQLIQALQQSATQFNNPDTLLGYGIPNLPVACQILTSLSVQHFHSSDQLITGPNPFQQAIEFSFISSRSKTMTASVSDITGKTVYRKTFAVTPGMVSRYVLNPALNDGVYILTVTTPESSHSRKIIRMN